MPLFLSILPFIAFLYIFPFCSFIFIIHFAEQGGKDASAALHICGLPSWFSSLLRFLYSGFFIPVSLFPVS
jgi:hypothetical protein